MNTGEGTSGYCDNCGAGLTNAFCGGCGQKVQSRNPSAHDLIHDFTHETLHVDGRIFGSVQKLLLAPGFLTCEYFNGRRVRWVSPIRLYLIFSVAYFVLASAAAARGLHVVGPVDTDPQTVSALQRLGFASEAELRETMTDAQKHWGPRVLFVLVPL